MGIKGNQHKYITEIETLHHPTGLHFKYFFLPFLAAAYPTLFLYASNVKNLLLTHLARTVLVYFLIAIVIYFLLSVFFQRGPLRTANATFVFLAFFNLYGFFEDLLLKLDWFPVHVYTTLPLIFVFISYSIWLLNKLKAPMAARLWNLASVVLTGLIAYNLVMIVPVELAKLQKSDVFTPNSFQTGLSTSQKNPDIYYILLDEFSGFEPMREYWHNSKVDDFVNYLSSKGFEVYEDSHGSSIYTPHEMATRLNYRFYPYKENPDPDTEQQWFNDIADNRVMSYLKQMGYTTVVFNEMQYPYPTATPIVSDVSYTYNDVSATNLGVFFDDFWMLVADKTMLKELSIFYKRLGSNQHSDFIFFTTKKIGELNDISSPKFIYAHLMMPHAPFMFDENGYYIAPGSFSNYGSYLGQYNFSISLAKKIVDGILNDSDPANPPVIILQSDHGMRNLTGNYLGQIKDFPEEYKTSILYARLMPGYKPTHSVQETDPINTFPIIFNYLFDANISLK
ncbi:hypothetical protein LARV_00466 [Longilinea arvoryzae]|uniref:Sulfatase N-terminal domain-containing protein n=2 Tax=Longilinea arvoryzae TaxID=360412 RepID=A0A0S7BGZ0_9CHLR|nr:hypothetical protein LARV_00466 [Longilinea arvoryzae]